jgi:hypothetical protein
MLASMVYQYLSHQPGCYTEEVCATLPWRLILPNDSQKGFMDQSAGLESVVSALAVTVKVCGS